MSKVRAIIIGIFIWILGAGFYTASYFISVLEDADLQANLVLAIALVPVVWTGLKLYYKNGAQIHGVKLGAIMLATGVFLDSLITVPYLIMPYGGSYQSFFGSIAFWLLAMEYILVVYAYWNFKVKPNIAIA